MKHTPYKTKFTAKYNISTVVYKFCVISIVIYYSVTSIFGLLYYPNITIIQIFNIMNSFLLSQIVFCIALYLMPYYLMHFLSFSCFSFSADVTKERHEQI